jgi:shikimate dehydrogenase
LYANHTDAEVIINATPVGMYPGNMVSPIDLRRFPKAEGVADVIYNPAKTKLLLDAEAAGIPCIDGLWMLAAQGYYAAKLFLNREIPEEKILEAYRSVRRECLNLVLVGMPGCGKSTQGKLAADLLGRAFVDLDAEIVKRFGPIPRIFEEQGEAGFRAIESEIVEEFGKESGLVIATGGGAVLREENVRALRQNGVICWLRRPAEQLATQGRPLSVNLNKLKEMEKTRLPLYQACADYSVNSQEQRTLTSQMIVEGFYEAAGAERAEPEPAGHSGKASLRNPDL